jgi:hypothetical protein
MYPHWNCSDEVTMGWRVSAREGEQCLIKMYKSNLVLLVREILYGWLYEGRLEEDTQRNGRGTRKKYLLE